MEFHHLPLNLGRLEKALRPKIYNNGYLSTDESLPLDYILGTDIEGPLDPGNLNLKLKL